MNFPFRKVFFFSWKIYIFHLGYRNDSLALEKQHHEEGSGERSQGATGGTLEICKLNSFECEISLLGNSLNAHRFNSKHKFGLMGVWACQKWSLSQHEIAFSLVCSFTHSLSGLVPRTRFALFRFANSTINIVEKCGKMQRKAQNINTDIRSGAKKKRWSSTMQTERKSNNGKTFVLHFISIQNTKIQIKTYMRSFAYPISM